MVNLSESAAGNRVNRNGELILENNMLHDELDLEAAFKCVKKIKPYIEF